MSENRFADATSLTSVVHQIVGAGSMCWEYVDRAGVFDSETAQEVASEGSERILELFRRETTDHYAEAERLLSAVGNTADAEDRRQCLAEAQVHATLAFVQWQRRTDVKHTNMSALRNEQAARGVRMIPWPPSDDLVERVARTLANSNEYGELNWRAWQHDARAVLDEVGAKAVTGDA